MRPVKGGGGGEAGDNRSLPDYADARDSDEETLPFFALPSHGVQGTVLPELCLQGVTRGRRLKPENLKPLCVELLGEKIHLGLECRV